MKLEELNLPIHTYNILKRANINDTETLVQFSAQQITMIRNGRQSDAEAVIKTLAEHDLFLSPTGKPDFKGSPKPMSREEFLKRDRTCYAERFPEPACSELKARRLLNLCDFTQVTQGYLFTIPGMTAEFIHEVNEGMHCSGMEFAEQKTNLR